MKERTGCDLPYLAVDEVEEAVAAYYGTIRLGTETANAIRSKLLAAIRVKTTAAEAEAKRQRRRILRLEAKRRKLLQAHLAGAVPLELLRDEQADITRELAVAGAARANTEIHLGEHRSQPGQGAATRG